MKVYLSGAMEGKDNYVWDFNLAKTRLEIAGYEVFNPCDNPTLATREDYMRVDIEALCQCDYIYYVNDVSASKGAFCEELVARMIGVKELCI